MFYKKNIVKNTIILLTVVIWRIIIKYKLSENSKSDKGISP